MARSKNVASNNTSLPETLEEAIILFYALAFGPIHETVLLKALNQIGMALPNGERITSRIIAPTLEQLEEEKLLVEFVRRPSSFRLDDIGNLECDTDLRWATFEHAQDKGWLLPFGKVLQQVDPGETAETSMEYKWDGQRFVSIDHASRDLFLAMEQQDTDEINRLIGLCLEDQHIPSPAHVLYPICVDPLHTDYLSLLSRDTQIKLLYVGMHMIDSRLLLNHAIFDYAQDLIQNDAPPRPDATFLALVAQLTQRHLLSGQLAQAQALLKAYPQSASAPLQGMMALLTGQLDTATETFAQIQKSLGKGKQAGIEYLRHFPSVLHTTLLVQSPEIKDRNLAKTWLNWVDRRNTPFQASFDCLSDLLVLNQDSSHERTGSLRVGPCTTDLEGASFLILFLLLHYCSGSEIPEAAQKSFTEAANAALATFKENQALWPCYQIAILLDKLEVPCNISTDETNSFFATSGLVDLSTYWAPKQIWETQLQALEELFGQSGTGGAIDGPRQTHRLTWKLKPSWDYDPHVDFGVDTHSSPVFAVIPVEQKVTPKGTWTKGREVSLSRVKNHNSEGLYYLTDQDRQVAKLIQTRSSRRYTQSSCSLSASQALLALVGHEHVFWEETPNMPVEITRHEPQVRILPQGEHLEITLDPMPYEDGLIQSIRVLQDAPNRLRVVEFLPMHKKIAEILGKKGINLPEGDKDKALKRLQGLSKHIAVQSNIAMNADHAQTVTPDSRPILRLQRLGQGLQAEMIVLPLGEGSHRSFVPGQGSRHLIDTLHNVPVQTQRDLDQENKHLNAILEQVPILRDFPHTHCLWQLDNDPFEALTLLEQLQALPSETLTVLWPKGNPITVRTVSPQQFQISIQSTKDWFELDGKVTVDEDLVFKMREFLDRIDDAQGAFIQLSDDLYLSLTEQFRRDLNLLQSTGKFKGKGDTLHIHPLAALGLDTWKDQVQSFDADPVFMAHMERIRNLENYHPELPSTLQAELRPYQQDAFLWLARLAEWGVGGCLADDMGLGKTIEALALILHRAAQGPTLVVAPTSVCANWIAEIHRFAPTLNPIRLGIDDQGKRQTIIKTAQPFDLLVSTYTFLQQETEALQETRFATLVLDEAQAIKNPNTKRSKAAMSLQGDFRMVCTGTPIENRLTELWNLFRFINPGLLGTQKDFNERFARTIEIHSDPLARHTLKSLITPFVLRRTKSQVLDDLPPRTELLRLVELSPEEAALHESLRQQAIEKLEQNKKQAPGQKHLQVLAELMKLRRCCCNPRLVVPNCGITGAKLEVFAELVDELRDNHHKALVFSQFVDHLTLLREHLDAQGIDYQYLDGQTPPKKREQRINDFQNGQGDLFLISLKAGGTGLNLTAADYVIHMDPWWNPAVEDQASDRAHRIGQTRPVTIYRLVTQGTIEEKIVDLHHQKRDLADSLLQETDTAHKLTADDLIALLKQA